jgi:biopolymer transport protein ExbD
MARKVPEINGGSMADIAFLLLIFFLVTTTMDVDKGIVRRLPPPPNPDAEPPDIKERNIFTILVNKNDRLLIEGEPGQLRDLRERVKKFINNPYGDENLPEKRMETIEYLGEVAVSKGIISLKNDRGTSYDMYIRVQNELAAAFRELKNELAQQEFNIKYDELAKKEYIKAIDKAIPVAISEAEPENVGD